MTTVAPQTEYTPGAIYLAGFTQARAPHIGVLLAKTPKYGAFFHIRIDRETSPNWQYQRRKQAVEGDMFLSSLLRISKTTVASDPDSLRVLDEIIDAAALEIPPPDNDEFGECAPWAIRLVKGLHERGVVELVDEEKLAEEVDEFARGSKAFASRNKFPNLASSKFCQ